MKKLVSLLCVGMMVLGLTACGGGNQDSESSQATEQSTSQAATEENTQEQNTTADETQEGGDTMQEDAANGDEAGTVDVTNGWSQEMQAVKDAIVETLGENYWPNTAIVPEMLEGTFGITSDMYSDYFGEMPMISTNVDTLVIIKAKDDKVEAVEKALNTYRENLVNDTMQYPMNLGKIQASRIERIGNYVCFVQLGADTMEALEKGEEAVITQCQEQNELVIEIINQNVQH